MRKDILKYYYYVENGTYLCYKSRIFQSQNNWLSKIIQRYNFTNHRHRNKKVNEFEEIRLRCQRFHSYFHHIICTNHFYSFDSNSPGCQYGYFRTHRLQSVDQVPPPVLIFLDNTWDKKGIHGPVFFFHPGAGSEKKCSIKICFRQT